MSYGLSPVGPYADVRRFFSRLWNTESQLRQVRSSHLCTNTRAAPSESPGIDFGAYVSTSPLMSGCVGFATNRVRSSLPQKRSASALPIPMLPGRAVPMNACGNPGAVFDIRIEFLIPGPNQRFSLERPTATFQPSARR